MENSTRFDLDGAIQEWRDQLKNSPSLKRENIEELEGHLRDSLLRLRGAGLSDEEAFLIARRRLGAFAEIEREYGKVNGEAVRIRQLLWMALGAVAWSTVASVAGAVSGVVLTVFETSGFLRSQWGAGGALLRTGMYLAGLYLVWQFARGGSWTWLHRCEIWKRPGAAFAALAAISLFCASLMFMLPALLFRFLPVSGYSAHSWPNIAWSSAGTYAVQMLIFPTIVWWLLRKQMQIASK